jgi:hypothetical protein
MHYNPPIFHLIFLTSLENGSPHILSLREILMSLTLHLKILKKLMVLLEKNNHDLVLKSKFEIDNVSSKLSKQFGRVTYNLSEQFRGVNSNFSE